MRTAVAQMADAVYHTPERHIGCKTCYEAVRGAVLAHDAHALRCLLALPGYVAFFDGIRICLF
jgi:hypothetical protein